MAPFYAKCASFLLETFEARQLLSVSNSGSAAPSSPPIPPVEPNIVGTVYLDRNTDGARGKTERGLRGFTVDLVNSAGATVDSVHTDRRGRFRFGGLSDGSTYTVKVESKNGFTATTDTTVSVTVATDSIKRVAIGESRMGTTPVTGGTGTGTKTGTGTVGTRTGTGGDSGSTPTPAAPARPNIVGLVYLDRNGDAKPQRRERGLSGFTVTLTDSNGTLVAETKTDRIGRYRFSEVADGTYTVSVGASAGYTASGAQTATIRVVSGTLARSAFGESSTSAGTTSGSTDGTSGASAATGKGNGGSSGTGRRGAPKSDSNTTGANTAAGGKSGGGSLGGSTSGGDTSGGGSAPRSGTGGRQGNRPPPPDRNGDDSAANASANGASGGFGGDDSSSNDAPADRPDCPPPPAGDTASGSPGLPSNGDSTT